MGSRYDEQMDELDSRRISLEVKQSEIAAALSLDRSTVRSYMNGSSGKKSTRCRIVHYLNSREFYKGYTFRSKADFALLLNDILEQFSGVGMTASEQKAKITEKKDGDIPCPYNIGIDGDSCLEGR